MYKIAYRKLPVRTAAVAETGRSLSVAKSPSASPTAFAAPDPPVSPSIAFPAGARRGAAGRTASFASARRSRRACSAGPAGCAPAVNIRAGAILPVPLGAAVGSEGRAG